MTMTGALRSQVSRLRYYWRTWRKHRAVERAGHKAVKETIRLLRERKSHGRFQAPLIGVFLAEHVGDIIACEPVVAWIRQHHREAHVIWFTRAGFADLVRYHPQLDGVVAVSSILDAERLMASSVFDHVIDLHIEGKVCSQLERCHWKTRGNRSITIGNYFRFGTLLEAFSQSAGLPPLSAGPRLFLSPSVHASVAKLSLPSDYVVFHTRSNEELRNWRDSKWRELAQILARKGRYIVEVGLQPTLTPVSTRIVDLCGKLSLLETAEVIRGARAFVGVDSGPAHMANAFNRPSVILLGRYKVFDRYVPFNGYLHMHAEEMLIHSPSACADTPVPEVLDRLERLDRVRAPADSAAAT